MEREEIRAPLKTPAWEATFLGVWYVYIFTNLEKRSGCGGRLGMATSGV